MRRTLGRPAERWNERHGPTHRRRPGWASHMEPTMGPLLVWNQGLDAEKVLVKNADFEMPAGENREWREQRADHPWSFSNQRSKNALYSLRGGRKVHKICRATSSKRWKTKKTNQIYQVFQLVQYMLYDFIGIQLFYSIWFQICFKMTMILNTI